MESCARVFGLVRVLNWVRDRRFLGVAVVLRCWGTVPGAGRPTSTTDLRALVLGPWD